MNEFAHLRTQCTRILQALGLLLWHQHDLRKSTQELANYAPLPIEWSRDERALFAQAIRIYGHDFHTIQSVVSIPVP